MTPDWKSLGLRDPEYLAADWMWRWHVPYKLLWIIPFGTIDVVLYGPCRSELKWSVLYDDHEWGDFDTLESAAAHLVKLGCGRNA